MFIPNVCHHSVKFANTQKKEKIKEKHSSEVYFLYNGQEVKM